MKMYENSTSVYYEVSSEKCESLNKIKVKLFYILTVYLDTASDKKIPLRGLNVHLL